MKTTLLIEARRGLGDWRTIRWGGRLDYRIEISQVLVNQQMTEAVFSKP